MPSKLSVYLSEEGLEMWQFYYRFLEMLQF